MQRTLRKLIQWKLAPLAVGMVLVVAAVGARQTGAGTDGVRPGAGERGFTAGRYAIELDGMMAGWIHSVEGGHATSDVVTEKTGAAAMQKKHLAGVKYE